MHDGGDTVKPCAVCIPDIRLDHLEPPVPGGKWIAKPQGVDDPDALAEREQLVHQHTSDVSGSTGYENHGMAPLIPCGDAVTTAQSEFLSTTRQWSVRYRAKAS